MPVHHPSGVTLVGINKGSLGRSCTCHKVCGVEVQPQAVFRIRWLEEISPSGRGEHKLAAFLVVDGVDTCKVGYIRKKSLVKPKKFYDGKLVQVFKVYDPDEPDSDDDEEETEVKRKMCRTLYGCAQVTVIDSEYSSGPEDYYSDTLEDYEESSSEKEDKQPKKKKPRTKKT